MREVFKEPPLVAFKRDRNLCDALVHSKTNKAVKSSSQTCRDGCKECQRIVRDEVSNTSGDSSYTPVRNGTCRTRNVIYGIICLRSASTVYVGETERELVERMKERLRDVRLGKDKQINSHFGEKGHRQEDLTFAVMEKVYEAKRVDKQLREAQWIKRLGTARPNGCNVKDAYVPTVY